eukprot:SAG31_NODE_883_length_11260_cov_38.912284_6_plen_175_part_00
MISPLLLLLLLLICAGLVPWRGGSAGEGCCSIQDTPRPLAHAAGGAPARAGGAGGAEKTAERTTTGPTTASSLLRHRHHLPGVLWVFSLGSLSVLLFSSLLINSSLLIFFCSDFVCSLQVRTSKTINSPARQLHTLATWAVANGCAQPNGRPPLHLATRRRSSASAGCRQQGAN